MLAYPDKMVKSNDPTAMYIFGDANGNAYANGMVSEGGSAIIPNTRSLIRLSEKGRIISEEGRGVAMLRRVGCGGWVQWGSTIYKAGERGIFICT